MKLGAFSISLTVKDIYASKAFYEKLGFHQRGGNIDQKWVVLKNEDGTVIGLFESMFRSVQQKLIRNGIEIKEAIDENSTGPAHFMIEDPDGNPILVDQHRQ